MNRSGSITLGKTAHISLGSMILSAVIRARRYMLLGGCHRGQLILRSTGLAVFIMPNEVKPVASVI